MKGAATFIHRWRLRIWRDIQTTTSLEWVAIAICVASVAYFLSSSGVTWRSIAMTIGMLVFGFMAASMVYDLWFGR